MDFDHFALFFNSKSSHVMAFLMCFDTKDILYDQKEDYLTQIKRISKINDVAKILHKDKFKI